MKLLTKILFWLLVAAFILFQVIERFGERMDWSNPAMGPVSSAYEAAAFATYGLSAIAILAGLVTTVLSPRKSWRSLYPLACVVLGVLLILCCIVLPLEYNSEMRRAEEVVHQLQDLRQGVGK